MSEQITDPTQVVERVREAIRAHAGWLIGAGVLAMLAGLFCIAAPLATGIAVNVVVGALFLMGGWIEVLGGLRLRKGTTGRGWLIFAGVLSALLGLYMMTQPLASLAALTWLLAIVLIVQGLLRCLSAFELRPLRGWGWMLFSGAVTFLLGGLLIANWPLSGAWAIGTIFGIYVLFAGLTLLQLGLAARAA